VDYKGRKLDVRLHFHQGYLESIYLFFFLPDESEHMVSGGYFPYNDAQRDQLHVEILKAELGETFRIRQPWGYITMGVDGSRNLSMIVIDYSKPGTIPKSPPNIRQAGGQIPPSKPRS